jgi:hypothetical protein
VKVVAGAARVGPLVHGDGAGQVLFADVAPFFFDFFLTSFKFFGKA